MSNPSGIPLAGMSDLTWENGPIRQIPGVFPIAAVVPIAKPCGARVVILNAEPTEMDHIADAVLRGGIADILPLIVGGAHSSV